MSQNLIDLSLDAATLKRIDTAIAQLEADLGGLIALSPLQRRRLTKMGAKSEAFCRLAVDVFGQHTQVLPRNFNLDALRRDLQMFDTLRTRVVRLSRLYERCNDTETALGSDLMNAALEGYAAIKTAGKGEGLDAMRSQLSARFTRRAKRESADTAKRNAAEE